MWEPAPSPPAQTPCTSGISKRGPGSYPALQPVQPGREDALTQGWTGPDHPSVPPPCILAALPAPSSQPLAPVPAAGAGCPWRAIPSRHADLCVLPAP